MGKRGELKRWPRFACLLLEVSTVTTQLLKALRQHFRAQLTSYGWRCLLSMALGMWIAEGKKVLAALTYLVSAGALSRFFNGTRWPAQAIRDWRRQLSEELIEEWYGGRGRPPLLYLILDGTVLQIGELALPWEWRAYVNRDRCAEEDFRKSTAQAIALIETFDPPRPGQVVVAVDSSLCTVEVIEAAVREGYDLVGWVRRDRRLEDGRSAREVPSGTVARLKGLEVPVKIVQMRRLGRRYTVISTNTELSVAQIRRRMRKRWWVEETIKQLKALGLEDCQCRGEQSLERWVEWVMLHYVLLARVRWVQRGVEWPAWRTRSRSLGGRCGLGGCWGDRFDMLALLVV